jgi:hypothetical protein
VSNGDGGGGGTFFVGRNCLFEHVGLGRGRVLQRRSTDCVGTGGQSWSNGLAGGTGGGNGGFGGGGAGAGCAGGGGGGGYSGGDGGLVAGGKGSWNLGANAVAVAGADSGNGQLTILLLSPVVTSVSPSSGSTPGGTSVTITGNEVRPHSSLGYPTPAECAVKIEQDAASRLATGRIAAVCGASALRPVASPSRKGHAKAETKVVASS